MLNALRTIHIGNGLREWVIIRQSRVHRRQEAKEERPGVGGQLLLAHSLSVRVRLVAP